MKKGVEFCRLWTDETTWLVRRYLRNILLSAYGNKENVDEDIVEIIRKPAEDEGALDAFIWSSWDRENSYGPCMCCANKCSRACVAQTNAAFLKLAGPQLVQGLKEIVNSGTNLLTDGNLQEVSDMMPRNISRWKHEEIIIFHIATLQAVKPSLVLKLRVFQY